MRNYLRDRICNLLIVTATFILWSCTSIDPNQIHDYSFIEKSDEDIFYCFSESDNIILLPIGNDNELDKSYNYLIEYSIFESLKEEIHDVNIIDQDSVRKLISSHHFEKEFERILAEVMNDDFRSLKQLNQIFKNPSKSKLLFTHTGNVAHYINANVFYAKTGEELWRGVGYSWCSKKMDQKLLISASAKGLSKRIGWGISYDTLPEQPPGYLNASNYFNRGIATGLLSPVILIIALALIWHN